MHYIPFNFPRRFYEQAIKLIIILTRVQKFWKNVLQQKGYTQNSPKTTILHACNFYSVRGSQNIQEQFPWFGRVFIKPFSMHKILHMHFSSWFHVFPSCCRIALSVERGEYFQDCCMFCPSWNCSSVDAFYWHSMTWNWNTYSLMIGIQWVCAFPYYRAFKGRYLRK